MSLSSKSFSAGAQSSLSDQDLRAYHYELPESQIAQFPVSPRDASRLLVLHRHEKRWEHRQFKDLPLYLDSNDLMVVNNTRVMKARLLGRRILSSETSDKQTHQINSGKWVGADIQGNEVLGGRVEFMMLEELSPRVWEGLFKASGKYLPGFQFQIPTPDGQGLRGRLIRGSGESPSGTVVAEFDRDPISSGAGEIPLPHYIDRVEDREENYQTAYAKVTGSAAAPTAGLHFTDSIIQKLKAQGVGWQELTLHVGLGTFRPVKNPDLSQHVMHEERYHISPEVAQAISRWKWEHRRVLAVGTTSVRTLESAWKSNTSGSSGTGELQPGSGRTSLFIRPGHFEFQVVDRILTNFHLPGSTLLMLISAFAGRELVLSAYQDAVKQGYRFFSYGDAMLIL